MLILPDAEAEVEDLVGKMRLQENHLMTLTETALPAETAASSNQPTVDSVHPTPSKNKIMSSWSHLMKTESRPDPKPLHAVLSSLMPLTTSENSHSNSTTLPARGQRYRHNTGASSSETPSRPAPSVLRVAHPHTHFHQSLLLKRQEEEQKVWKQYSIISHSIPNLAIPPPYTTPQVSKHPEPAPSFVYGLLSETLADPGPRPSLHTSNITHVARSRTNLPTVNEISLTRGSESNEEDEAEQDEEEEEEGHKEALLSYLYVKFTRSRQRRLTHRIFSHWLWLSNLRSEGRRALEGPEVYDEHINPLFHDPLLLRPVSSHLLPPPPPSSPPLYGEMRSLLMQMEQVANGRDSIFAANSPPPPLPLPPPMRPITKSSGPPAPQTLTQDEDKASELEARIKHLEELMTKNLNPPPRPPPTPSTEAVTKVSERERTPRKRATPRKKLNGGGHGGGQIDLKKLEKEEKKVQDDLIEIERALIRKRGRALRF